MSYRCEILTDKVNIIATNKYKPEELRIRRKVKYQEDDYYEVSSKGRYSIDPKTLCSADFYFYDFIREDDDVKYVCIGVHWSGGVFNIKGGSRLYLFVSPVDGYGWPESDDPEVCLRWLVDSVAEIQNDKLFVHVSVADGVSNSEADLVRKQIDGRDAEIAADLLEMIKKWGEGINAGTLKKGDSYYHYDFHSGLEAFKGWKQEQGSGRDQFFYDQNVYAWYASRVLGYLHRKPFPQLRIDWQVHYKISNWAVKGGPFYGADYANACEQFREAVPVQPYRYKRSWHEELDYKEDFKSASPLKWPDTIIYRMVQSRRNAMEGAYAAAKSLQLPSKLEIELQNTHIDQWTVALGEELEHYVSQEYALTLEDEAMGELKQICHTYQRIMTGDVLPDWVFSGSFEKALISVWQICKRVEDFIDGKVRKKRRTSQVY